MQDTGTYRYRHMYIQEDIGTHRYVQVHYRCIQVHTGIYRYIQVHNRNIPLYTGTTRLTVLFLMTSGFTVLFAASLTELCLCLQFSTAAVHAAEEERVAASKEAERQALFPSLSTPTPTPTPAKPAQTSTGQPFCLLFRL